MFGDLDIDEVATDLWVGPYPSDPFFIATLAEEVGIRGLVSVQTDDDLAILRLNWSALEAFITNRGLALARVPIRDFDNRALGRGLPEAIAAVHFFRSTGRRTYLHCTAGLNRSPSVAVAYLVAHRGLTLDEAWAQVTEGRRCLPARKVLARWYKRHLKELKR